MEGSEDQNLQKSPEHNIGGVAVSEDKHNKRKKIIKYFAVGAGAFLVFLLALSTQLSFNRVTFAGQKLDSRVSRAEIDSLLDTKLDAYQILIEQEGKTQAFKLTDIGVSVDQSDSVDSALNAKKPKNLFKRLAFWSNQTVPLKLNTDDKKQQEFTKKYLIRTTKPAKNASLSVSEGKIVAQNDISGKAFTVDNPEENLLARVKELSSEPLSLQLQEIKPDITAEDTKPVQEKVKALLAKKIIFNLNENNLSASPADIGRWLEFTPIKKDHTIDLTVNSGKILEHINAVAAPYVQPPRNAILIPASAGQKQSLIPGQDGIDVVNKEAIAARVAKNILTSDNITEKLPVKYQKFKTINATLHDKWLAVDLTNKRMYAYEKTKLVKSFLISAGAPDTPTVEGTYKIYRKLVSQDMSGANVDGSRYFQAGVMYVNYFHADYAIHGNHWRPLNYFGNINSSHGCVGIVNADAAWIYKWAPVGTTVLTFS
jgi:lipoprotein-anchoring transpeptidase ErfK/SrfK